MILTRTAIDFASLPADLLAPFKAWARIDHTDDDAGLQLLLARCIDSLERQLGIAIAPASWLWIPREEGQAPTDTPQNRLACCNGNKPASWAHMPTPLRGIVYFTVDRDGTDATGEFRLTGSTSYGDFAQTFLDSAAGLQVADAVTLDVGVGTATNGIAYTDMPPALLDLIFRYALFIWENRESAAERAFTEMPDWINREWSTFWTPTL